MTTRGVHSSAPRRAKLPTLEKYAEFVEQIELLDIWLVETHVVNHHGPNPPRQAAVSITTPEASWTNVSDGFDVHFPYEVRFAQGDVVHAEIGVTFGLHFSSSRPMTEPIFRVFKDVNLPINSWPFLREAVSTAIGRMGWPSFTIPALKQGATAPGDDGEAPSAPKRRRRTSGRTVATDAEPVGPHFT